MTKKQELRDEIDKLRYVGWQMANVCFNLSQRPSAQVIDCDILASLVKQWDDIKRCDATIKDTQ